MKYSVFDKVTGECVRTGDCPESMFAIQAQPGEVVLPIQCDPVTQKLNMGTWKLEGKTVNEYMPTYDELRRIAYPPIAEQLDAIWKGGAAESAMRAKIMDVKAKIPKE